MATSAKTQSSGWASKTVGWKIFAWIPGSLQKLLRIRFFNESYQREALLVLLLGLGTYFYIALATFSPFDSSHFAASFPDRTILNKTGQTGAFIAGWSIHWFGLISYLLPLPFISIGVFSLRGFQGKRSRNITLGWSLIIGAAMVVTAMGWSHVKIEGISFPGAGALGSQLAAFLIGEVGPVGTWVLIITANLIATSLIFQRPLILPAWEKLKATSLPSFPFKIGKSPGTPKVISTEEVEGNGFHEPIIEQPQIPTTPREITIDEKTVERSFFTRKKPRKVSSKEPSNYKRPDVNLFAKTDPDAIKPAFMAKDLEATAELLVRTFADFGIEGKIVDIKPGPVVTVFEFQPKAGIKQSKVMGLIDDLALALRVDSIFINPVRGKRALGVQVPNKERQMVLLGDLIDSDDFETSPSPLTVALGKSLSGTPVVADLTAMPHLLCAGATGAGKSVAINAFLCSVIAKSGPEEVKMILVDPKMLELSVYEGIPHLLMPVITEPKRASLALKWAVAEMERRYKLMQLAFVRNIEGFNRFWDKASADRKEEMATAVGADQIEKLPYILVVVDELADLMLSAPKDVEASIQRLAQKARASGIHLVLATQRPSVDIITGVIKANLPSRLSFQVVSKHDSRTILDQTGADKLLGKGDMLFQRPGVARLERIQSAFVSDEEVVNVVEMVKENGQAQYDDHIITWIEEALSSGDDMEPIDTEGGDDKFEDAVALASSYGAVSASFLQRHLKIGYNRAARIVEDMERRGMVGEADGSKPRKWLSPENP